MDVNEEIEKKIGILKKSYPIISGEIENHIRKVIKKKMNKNITLDQIEEGMKLDDYPVLITYMLPEIKQIVCPACQRIFRGKREGEIVKCESLECGGQERELKETIDQIYVAGNCTGVILIHVLPEFLGINEKNLEGYVAKISGNVRKKGVFRAYQDKYLVDVQKIKLLYNIFEENTLTQYSQQEKKEEKEDEVQPKQQEPEWVEILEATIQMSGGFLTDDQMNFFMTKLNLKQNDVEKYFINSSEGKWLLKKIL